MFDRTALPPASLEFVVIADTHYFLPPADGQQVEFASRLRQAARAERALRLAASLGTAFVVHLGDVVQAVPESPDFARAVARAHAQLAECGIRPYHVAGNQDIGDKPDPTMPQDWVTAASLAAFHRQFGPSWYSFPAGDRHCIVLNSQIMNSTLPEAEEQRAWVEAELSAKDGRPIILFTHLPLYLHDANEPYLGHYDNLGEPARHWLLGLIRRYPVELVLTGHSHWAFFDRIGQARYYVTPSTSHTRPGFSELFSSAPPPEQGRDDTDKLGFSLVRLQADGPRVHFLRTAGETRPLDRSEGAAIITRLARDLPASRLGVTLTQPLATIAEVPLAWPSAIRQRVRNDYPLLSCTELGVRYLRVPEHDFRDPVQRRRLALLRDEGVALWGCALWSGAAEWRAMLAECRDLLDGIELQLPGTRWPSGDVLEAVGRCRAEDHLPVALAPVLPGEPVPGKQLRRTRLGYRPDELGELDRRLAVAGVALDRALCRLLPDRDPFAQMQDGRALALGAIGALDWVLDPATIDPAVQLRRLALALFALATIPSARLAVEPLLDLDRTMDVCLGLLDRRCNPHPAFHALRTLNTLIFGQAAAGQQVAVSPQPGLDIYSLRQATDQFWLVVPQDGRAEPGVLNSVRLLSSPAALASAQWIDLATARHIVPTEEWHFASPLLIVARGAIGPIQL